MIGIVPKAASGLLVTSPQLRGTSAGQEAV
jgi:hypothetical protein